MRQFVHGRLVLDAAHHDQLSIAEPVAPAHGLVERADLEPQSPEILNRSRLERLAKKETLEPLARVVRMRHLRKSKVFPHLRTRRDRPLHWEKGASGRAAEEGM